MLGLLCETGLRPHLPLTGLVIVGGLFSSAPQFFHLRNGTITLQATEACRGTQVARMKTALHWHLLQLDVTKQPSSQGHQEGGVLGGMGVLY